MAYTENAKTVLSIAKRMAKKTGQNYIGTEHILVGLLKEQNGVASKVLAENGVEYDEETVIQRDIFMDGKNVCRVNGALVTVAILHKLGVQLINIHGQHDSATLFDEENHLSC